jgi:hypothetical protein
MDRCGLHGCPTKAYKIRETILRISECRMQVDTPGAQCIESALRDRHIKPSIDFSFISIDSQESDVRVVAAREQPGAVEVLEYFDHLKFTKDGTFRQDGQDLVSSPSINDSKVFVNVRVDW